MKKYFFPVMIAFSMIAFAGCAAGYVDSQPADVVDVQGVAPGPDYVWIGGDWVWSGGTYVWHSGHWVRGRAGRSWNAGHWEHGGRGFRWHRGGWR
ncbi:MAG TPA: YXWGXW repeat-containing protein [Puia sp.]|nr:YXWGXW repeat-containing protein [Puia sp.]